MFRHTGGRRTYSHNLKLASALSTVAGIVNIVGLLSFGVLTTNVTGHFAFFSEELALEHLGVASQFLMFVLCFLAGAFASNWMMEYKSRKYGVKQSYVLPILTESICLFTVILIVCFFQDVQKSIILAYPLLFAMGLQNALVTQVSKSVVRTTHLTGIFTDLGIELSQLVFTQTPEDRFYLKKRVNLKLMIILGFLGGGVVGGLLHHYIGIVTLLLPVFLLIVVLFYDNIRLRFYYFKRKHNY